MKQKINEAYFAAGCFWGVEAKFRCIRGVIDVVAGYSGGSSSDPTYDEVSSGKTGHAEAVMVYYNPLVVAYKDLVEAFWNMHDPTQVGGQGPDMGSHYRSAIFYRNHYEESIAKQSMSEKEKSRRYRGKLTTEIKPFERFYQAEEFHQRYLAKRGLVSCTGWFAPA